MWKRIGLATLAVFVAWQILDYLMHSVILMSSYAATPQLWRPMGEMKMALMMVVSLIVALVFVYIYAKLISKKSLKTGLIYGLLYGIAGGISMGYGTYSVMPITYGIALGWFLGTVVEMVAAGAIAGWLVKEPQPAPAAAAASGE